MCKRFYIFLFFCLCCFSTTVSQRFVYDVDFLTYFDNRESRISTYPSQTLFGIRLSPEVGVEFSDSVYGSHRLMAGVSYLQPFGSAWRDARIFPTVYYQFRKYGFNVSLGFIPWRASIGRLPEYLLSDSLHYCSPNIQGALFSHSCRNGYIQFICDWRGMPSKNTREAFRLILSAQYHTQWFFYGGNAQLNHLANKAKSEPRLGVCDDITVQPFIGVDFSHITPFDTLALRTSYLYSFQRDRNLYGANHSHGFLAELALKWRFLELRNTFYCGQPVMPLYGQYGSILNQGESNYQHPTYNHTELSVYIIQYPFANICFSWDFHFVPHMPIAHQQQLTACFNLEQLMNALKHKDSINNQYSFKKRHHKSK